MPPPDLGPEVPWLCVVCRSVIVVANDSIVVDLDGG